MLLATASTHFLQVAMFAAVLLVGDSAINHVHAHNPFQVSGERTSGLFGDRILFGKDGGPADSVDEMTTLTLVDLVESTFNAIPDVITFNLEGGTLDDFEAPTLMLNGVNVLDFTTEGTSAQTSVTTLEPGENTIMFSASNKDSSADDLDLDLTIWAGSGQLTVTLVDDASNPFVGETSVVASLADNSDVTVEVTTTTGMAVFMNVPPRTILVQATGPNVESGSAGIFVANTVSISIEMEGFNVPSEIDNNDFSQGTDGWDIPDQDEPFVAIVQHVEDVGPGYLNEEARIQTNPTSPVRPRGGGRQLFFGDWFEGESNNKDLKLPTDGIFDDKRS